MARALESSNAATATLWPRWTLGALLVLGIAGFYMLGLERYFSWDFVQAHVAWWQSTVRAHPIVAVLLFLLLYATVTALSLPVAAILSLLGGALFGRWLGTAVVSVAATLGASLAFLSSRWLLRDWVRRRFAHRLAPLEHGWQTDGAYYLFTLRLVPAVPFFLINLGMGLTPMPLATFAAVSWLGMLLGTFLYANAGTEFATLESPAGLLSWPVLSALALLGIVPLLVRWLVRWSRRPHGEPR